MLKVGITGGIGSGKSIVAKLFALLGVPVYNADDAAKELMNHDESLKSNLIREFGVKTYENDQLNRQWLAARVFNDPAALQTLNNIVHPVVIAHGTKWIAEQAAPLVMKEAAIFFESGSYKEMDYMIGVSAPKALRIARTMKRDQVSRESVLERMNRQMDESEKMERCDAILINDDQHLLIPQVIELHAKLLAQESAEATKNIY